MTKTLVVGVDAACWRRMDPLIERGDLPNLERLRQNGISGTLKSTSPPMTPPAWTSMVTGVGPEIHGIHDFVAMDPETHRVAPMGDTRLPVPAIWDVFAAAERRLSVLNLPMIYPPRAVPGWFVSGFPHAIDDGIAFPDELQTRLSENGYAVQPGADPTDPHKYLTGLEEVIDRRTGLVLQAIEETDAELIWTVYMAVDWTQHYLWGRNLYGKDAVDIIYRRIDQSIGRLIEAVGEDWNIFVISDHGATEIQYELHLNELLDRWGYLERASRGPVSSAGRLVVDRALSLGSRLPGPIKEAVKHQISSSNFDRLREAAGHSQLSLHKEIDWADTSAFSFGYMGQIHINRSDWFGNGSVQPEDYETIRDNIVDLFESLTHPKTGESLIASARTADSVFGTVGPTIPDVLVEPQDWSTMMYGDAETEWLKIPTDRVADHHPNGVVLAAGPAFREGTLDMEAVDVTPTLLYLHGLPVPTVVDGSVRERFFDADFRSKYEISRESMTTSTDTTDSDGATEEDVEDRLADLGYL